MIPMVGKIRLSTNVTNDKGFNRGEEHKGREE